MICLILNESTLNDLKNRRDKLIKRYGTISGSLVGAIGGAGLGAISGLHNMTALGGNGDELKRRMAIGAAIGAAAGGYLGRKHASDENTYRNDTEEIHKKHIEDALKNAMKKNRK